MCTIENLNEHDTCFVTVTQVVVPDLQVESSSAQRSASMSGVVNVFVSSADTHSERRIDPHLTVAQLKAKLEPITGIPVANQTIALYSSDNDPRLLTELLDDSQMLEYYGIADWQVLKVSLDCD